MAFNAGGESPSIIAATTAGAASTFGVLANFVRIANDGPNTAYVSIVSTAGTTAGFPIKINESLDLRATSHHSYFAGVSAITSTSTGAGPTASVRVYAIQA